MHSSGSTVCIKYPVPRQWRRQAADGDKHLVQPTQFSACDTNCQQHLRFLSFVLFTLPAFLAARLRVASKIHSFHYHSGPAAAAPSLPDRPASAFFGALNWRPSRLICRLKYWGQHGGCFNAGKYLSWLFLRQYPIAVSVIYLPLAPLLSFCKILAIRKSIFYKIINTDGI